MCPSFLLSLGRELLPIFVHISFVEILEQPEIHLDDRARLAEIAASLFIPDVGSPDHLQLLLLVITCPAYLGCLSFQLKFEANVFLSTQIVGFVDAIHAFLLPPTNSET